MSIVDRITTLITSNLNHLLDKAENPEVMIKQIIREMEEGIIEMRTETAKALSRLKQLEQKIASGRNQVKLLEQRAADALAAADEGLARNALSRKLSQEKALERHLAEKKEAEVLVSRLKDDLARLEDHAQAARRKREDLVRRKRNADAQAARRNAGARSQNALQSIEGIVQSFDENVEKIEAFEDAVGRMEAEVAASEEVYGTDDQFDEQVRKLEMEKAVEAELARLKKLVSGKKKISGNKK